MKQLAELINHEEPGWALVQKWINSATNPVEILPPSEPSRSDALLAVQVTTRSPMGAVIFESGGLLILNGWLRVLGSGHPRLPRSIHEWNSGRTFVEPDINLQYYLIADDVVGGFFALDGGGLGKKVGQLFYFGPDSLKWEPMDMNYSQFLNWCFTGDLIGFYEPFFWKGWEGEVKKLPGDRGYMMYPFPSISGPPLGERYRGEVPMAELYSLHVGNIVESTSTRLNPTSHDIS